MATNAEEATDDSKPVTEEDLRKLKEDSEVESPKGEDEAPKTEESEEESEEASEEDGQTDDPQEEESEETDETESDEETSFVKEFTNIKGDTLEDYAKGLEEAYKNSTAEAMRLKALVDKPETKSEEEDPGDFSPTELYMKQKMDEEITSAFTEFSKHFPQVRDEAEYGKFTREVATLSQTILQSQKRLASPKELYSKAAVILGWEPEDKVDGKNKLDVALKDRASTSKTNSSTKKTSKSKVTDQMVAANRLMYPDKSDAEIREELEPFVT